MPPEISINLHPINFVIISGIIQSIILSVILISYKKGNRSANIFIGLVVLICSLHFSWPLVIDTNIADRFRWSFSFPYSFLLALGPLLLFYAKSLATPDFRVNRKDWIHILPVIVEVVVQLVLIIQSVRNNRLLYEVPGFLLFRAVEFSGAALSIFVYGKQALAILQRHEVWVADNFSNKKDITLFWLYQLIRYFRILFTSWLFFELSFMVFQRFQLHFIPVYLLLYMLLALMTYSCYWIGIQAMIKSEVLTEKRSHDSLPQETGSSYSKLSSTLMKEYSDSLERIMRDEKLYLEETLSLRTLAARLKLDANLVSFVLNTVMKKSFYDYVNEFRIDEVKRKIQDPAYQHIKIVEIGFECGFNSKATFNRVFKKCTGKSPSQYKAVN